VCRGKSSLFNLKITQQPNYALAPAVRNHIVIHFHVVNKHKNNEEAFRKSGDRS
jgi:hypothetical protein